MKFHVIFFKLLMELVQSIPRVGKILGCLDRYTTEQEFVENDYRYPQADPQPTYIFCGYDS